MSNKETNKAEEEIVVEEETPCTCKETPCTCKETPCTCKECAESIPAGGFVPEGGFQGIHPRLQKTLRPKNKKLPEADTK